MNQPIDKFKNCSFFYKCPLDWETFLQTDNDDIRFCSECNENVFRAYTEQEFNKLGEEGRCVVIMEDDEFENLTSVKPTMGIVDHRRYELGDRELKETTSLSVFKKELSKRIDFSKGDKTVSEVYKKKLVEFEEAMDLYENLLDELHDLKCKETAQNIIEDFEEIKTLLYGYSFTKIIDIRIKDIKERMSYLQVCENLITKRINTLEIHAPQCTKCNKRMVVRDSSNGYFWGCSTYPDCWGKRILTKEEQLWLDTGKKSVERKPTPTPTPIPGPMDENPTETYSDNIGIIELLAQGIDPNTGEVLVEDHLINSPKVIRALYEVLNIARQSNIKGDVEDLSLNDNEQEIFGQLKDWRMEISKDRGMPAYIIVEDKALKRVVINKPSSINELLKIKGFGEKRVNDFGLEIISILEESIGI